jgi:hypothetical protein
MATLKAIILCMHGSGHRQGLAARLTGNLQEARGYGLLQCAVYYTNCRTSLAFVPPKALRHVNVGSNPSCARHCLGCLADELVGLQGMSASNVSNRAVLKGCLNWHPSIRMGS